MRPRLLEEDFIETFSRDGAEKLSRDFKMSVRSVHARRRGIEQRRGIIIPTGGRAGGGSPTAVLQEHPGRLHATMQDGHILIGSDSHYWPGIISTAHRAFVKFNKEFKPKIVVKNGDELDFPAISRHPSIGWEKRPAVVTEIETASERLSEIENANNNATYYWPLGNHDARFETRLATVAGEYAKVHGVHLKDHFPRWKPCWSVWVNDEIVIKHRLRGGMHATRNNTLNAGKSIVTGHLHSLKIAPLSDYNGTRWGIDCGTMADPYGPQFENYTEDSPKDWRSGFVLLTVHKGRLLWPEIVFVSDEEKGEVTFRGKVMYV